MSIKPADIVSEVRSVLSSASRGKGDSPKGLTAYQIADRLSERFPVLYRNLETEKSVSGRDSLFHTIAKACLLLASDGEVTYTYMDAEGMEFDVAGGRIRPQYSVIAIYQLG